MSTPTSLEAARIFVAALTARGRAAGLLRRAEEPEELLSHGLDPFAPGLSPHAALVVARLWAQHPQLSERPRLTRTGDSLARSFRRLVERRRREGRPYGELEQYFQRLIERHTPEDMARPLEHDVRLLFQADVPVSFARLLADLSEWEREDRAVQRRWAREFWGAADDLWPGRVAALMEERGWTQERLAQEIGVRRATVADWVAGRFTPTGENAAALERLENEPPT